MKQIANIFSRQEPHIKDHWEKIKVLKSRFNCKFLKNFCLRVLNSVISALPQEIVKSMKQAYTAFSWHQPEGHSINSFKHICDSQKS